MDCRFFYDTVITGTNLAWNAKAVDITVNELTLGDIRERLVDSIMSIRGINAR